MLTGIIVLAKIVDGSWSMNQVLWSNYDHSHGPGLTLPISLSVNPRHPVHDPVLMHQYRPDTLFQSSQDPGVNESHSIGNHP